MLAEGNPHGLVFCDERGMEDDEREEEQQEKTTHPRGLRGADGRTRTGDLLITNQLLYQLSYVGNVRLGAATALGSWTGPSTLPRARWFRTLYGRPDGRRLLSARRDGG